MFQPILYRIKVKPDEVEEVTKAGIILVNKDREQKAGMTGIVIAAGEGVFDRQETVKVGDRILYVKFAGTLHTEGDAEYRYINDEDVIAVERGEG